MRRNRESSTGGVASILGLILCLAPCLPAAAARGPVPVSPGAQAQSAAVEARCPTFQWAGVAGARGYELAVFGVTSDGAEPSLVSRASVPGDARGWTPSAGDCLERGQRYAWSVAAYAGQGEEIAWSLPFLFEVEAAPSLDELEQAIATIERYRTHGSGVTEAGARPEARVGRPAPPDLDSLPATVTSPTTGITRIASEANTPTLGTPSLRVSANVALSESSNLFKEGVVFLWDDTTGNTALGRSALASVSGGFSNTAVGRGALQGTTASNYNTAIGAYALTLNTGTRNTASGGLALQINTTGFRNTAIGFAALRFNTTGYYNTASGNYALLSNNTGNRNTASGVSALRFNTTGIENTASGFGALRYNTTGLRNTASGVAALSSNTTGLRNTASGFDALLSNTTGSYNTASGMNALRDNTTGGLNTASGFDALRSSTAGSDNTASGGSALFNTTGSRNTAVGRAAGSNATTGDDNIFIGYGAFGEAGDGHTIRIGGTSTGGEYPPGPGEQNRTFINGIQGITANHDAIGVVIDSAGQLGTVSSSRAVKQDIQDLGPLADRLLELRPVAFRYRQHAAIDPDTPLQFGLIAEEVAEVFPELVVYDGDGKPETIKYHLLSSLLLGELQRQNDEARRQHGELQRQRADARRQQAVVLEQGAEIERLSARLEAVEHQGRPATQRDDDRWAPGTLTSARPSRGRRALALTPSPLRRGVFGPLAPPVFIPRASQ